jgi:hypothetical protein
LLQSASNAQQLGLTRYQLLALSRAARAARALGLTDSSLAMLREAAHLWESVRSVPQKPEWREERGTAGRMIYADLASHLLEYPPTAPAQDRIRAAFDALQPFKARTLLERMLGPGKDLGAAPEEDIPEPITLEMLQGSVLAEGELFLDCFMGSDASFMFAVTCEECRVVRLPSDMDLGPKLRVFQELLATLPGPDPAADAELLAQSRRHLGNLLLGDVIDLLERSTRILVALDGPLNLIPFAELMPAPEISDSMASAAGAPVDAKEWLRTPSATILGWQRLRAPPPDSVPGLQILAVAGRETDSGEELSGAMEEVRGLRDRYVGIDAEIVSGESDSAFAPERLCPYDVLHLAAHVRLLDQRPWHSAICFSGGDGAGDLRAGRIAGMQLPARLAVLSSCASARGRILSGEGVQGLCGAFLSAGVRAVIATLWPVDDQTTRKLMALFYSRLAQGENVAKALRSAQMTLSRESRTSDPFYWAGFVLVGDGDVQVPLQERKSYLWIAAVGILLLVGLTLLWRYRPRTGSR